MNVSEEAGKQYANVMAEIKRRSRVIHHYMSGSGHTVYRQTTAETLCLQFRKIFELIAFGSLAANKKIYSQAHTSFERHWEADKLIKNLRRLNPDFYPKPVKVVKNPAPGVVSQFDPMTEGFLTSEELIEAHGRCGSLLHATNPFKKPLDLDEYDKRFVNWYTRIVNLLNTHNVHLLGETGFWHIQMCDFSTDNVQYNYFARVEEK